jgi:predicted transcriptional regulator
VSTEQLIKEFKALSLAERQRVAEAIFEDDSWIPESFREGMRDLEAGRTVSMEKALSETPPGVSE